jgi:hypothetical protein
MQAIREDERDVVAQAAMQAVLEFQLVELQERYTQLHRVLAQAVLLLGTAVLEQEN